MFAPIDLAAAGVAFVIMLILLVVSVRPAPAQESSQAPPIDQRASATVDTATFGLG